MPIAHPSTPPRSLAADAPLAPLGRRTTTGRTAAHRTTTGQLNESAATVRQLNERLYAFVRRRTPQAVGGNRAAALRHWLDTGLHEGRRASAVFDPTYYLQANAQANAQVRAQVGWDRTLGLMHWVREGRVQGLIAVP